jgi:acyl-CoA hydrolase
MSYTSTCPITYFTPKKCNELNDGGGGVLNFLDEGGGVLKIKVSRSGAALKNVQYLVFITQRPPPPPPIINDRSLI